MSEHEWIKERVGEFLAGGLEVGERARFEGHVAACGECAGWVSEMRELETDMTNAMSAFRPDGGFEGRLIAGLGRGPGRVMSVWRIDAVRRAVVGVAAAVVVGGIGFAGVGLMEGGRLPFALPGMGEGVARDGSGVADVRSRLALSFTNPFRDNSIARPFDQNGLGHFPSAVMTDRSELEKGQQGEEFYKIGRGFGSLQAAKSQPPRTGLPSSGQSDSAERDKKAMPRYRVSEQQSRASDSGSERERTVDALVKQSRTLVEQARYADALGALDQALAIDPKNDYANGVRPLVEDKAMLQAERKYREDYGTQLAKQYSRVDPNLVPYDDLLRFPANWPDISARQQSVKEKSVVYGAPSDRNDSVLLPTDDDSPAKPKQDVLARGNIIAGIAEPVIKQPAEVVARKIIRSGVATYEVEVFDSAFSRVSEIVSRAGGYVGGSSSEKLPNGKVRGVIVLRMPPERLDGVLAELRGIGELKSQNIEASDVTRQFVDSEGKLKAARAVESRLLDIIANGKGEIKDLVAAEKELGEWRTKIEALEGELRYLSSQVALSTLTLTVAEKEISAAAVAVQTEEISAAIEAQDVSKARDGAVAAVVAAKGRVIESELKQQGDGSSGGGQVVGRIAAEMPQEASAGFIATLRGLGTVAKLEVQKKQVVQGDSAQAGSGGGSPKVEARYSRVVVALVAQGAMTPKVVQVADVAVADVRGVYERLLGQVRAAGGSVKENTINEKSDAADVTAVLRMELPTAGAEAFMAEVRGAGLVLRSSSQENAAGSNVTDSRRGFAVSLVSAAKLAPREVWSVSVQVARGNVGSAAAAVLAKVAAAGGRVEESGGTMSPDGNGNQRLVIDMPLNKEGEVLGAIRGAGKVMEETTQLATDAPAGELARARVSVVLASSPELVPADQGVGAALRRALTTSLLGLLWSLQLVVIGLCLVLPWVVVVWVGVKVWRRRRARVVGV